MIKSKEDLRFYLAQDYKSNVKYSLGNPSVLKYYMYNILCSEPILAFHFLKKLRRYEYCLNCRKGKGVIGNFEYFIRKFIYMRAVKKNNIFINPNTVGYGLRLPHVIGCGIIVNCKKVGNFCTINTGVVIGQKNNNSEKATIGDNVEICPGAKVIGLINVGDDVVIAPNSVVVKDVPNKAVVSGIPSKIIKYKD